MLFSERKGIVQRKIAQLRHMDNDLRISLWNAMVADSFHALGRATLAFEQQRLLLSIWIDIFKEPIDEIPRRGYDCIETIKSRFLQLPWNGVYDFLEVYLREISPDSKPGFIERVNQFLERENAAYRVINQQIVELTSSEEIAEVEMALNAPDVFKNTTHHLDDALKLYSDRTDPDYKNSIKESLSAVEATARTLLNKSNGTLGELLDELERTKSLHPALKQGISKIYGYASDSGGIRHASKGDAPPTKVDARFMMIVCSAFINFAIATIAI